MIAKSGPRDIVAKPERKYRASEKCDGHDPPNSF
jgi:hypothetical protein